MRMPRRSFLLAVLLTACAPAAPSPGPTAAPASQATAAPAAKPAEATTAPAAKPAESKPAEAAKPVNTPITAAPTAAAAGAPAPKPGGDIIFGQDSEPDTLDPHVTGSRHTTIAIVNVFDTLL